MGSVGRYLPLNAIIDLRPFAAILLVPTIKLLEGNAMGNSDYQPRKIISLFHRQLCWGFLRNFACSMVVFGVMAVSLHRPDTWPPSGEMLSFTVLFFVHIVDFVLPLALLVATLFTIGPLARYQELTALSSAGWSLMQITWPLVLVASLAVVYAGAVRALGLIGTDTPSSLTAASQTARHADQAYPLVNLLATLTGIILGSSPRRHTVYENFGRALSILFGYYVVAQAAVMMGKHGWLPPVAAGWLGVGVFAVVLGWLWWRPSSRVTKSCGSRFASSANHRPTRSKRCWK